MGTYGMQQRRYPQRPNPNHVGRTGYHFYYNGQTLVFFKNRASYELAERHCARRHGTLLTIETQEKQIFVNSVMQDWMPYAERTMGSWSTDDTRAMSWWIGGHYVNDTTWAWVNDSPMPTASNGMNGNWMSSQDTHATGRDCVSMSNLAQWPGQYVDMFGKWFSSNCQIEKHYICQYEGEVDYQIFTEYVVDYCYPNPCQNGGQCQSTGVSYTCACVGGYTGYTCDIPPPTAPSVCCQVPLYGRTQCGYYGVSPYDCQRAGCCWDDAHNYCHRPAYSGSCNPQTTLPPPTKPPMGSWLLWSGWSECSTSCGKGTWVRIRGCWKGVPGGLGCRGVDREVGECHDQPDCGGWRGWMEWSACSATCGKGYIKRVRTCYGSSPSSAICPGLAEEVEECDSGYNCASWSSWSEFTACSVSCGGGTFTRTRTCIGGIAGEKGCEGSSELVEQCNSEICPSWSAWGEYTVCTASCGGGIRSRTRSCMYGTIGQIGCNTFDESVETVDCNTNIPCGSWSSWSDYGKCSVSCGVGIMIRKRICNGGTIGFGNCIGESSEPMECRADPCPYWSTWGEYSMCTVSCDGGVRKRVRICIGGDAGDYGCSVGLPMEEMPCNMQACEYWDDWSEWEACTKTCDGGKSVRTRMCIGGLPQMPGCLGPIRETADCNENPCPQWDGWVEWSDCSATCGGGRQTRSRVCMYGDAGQVGCKGFPVDTRICNAIACETWSPWSTYASCSTSCGGGVRTRIRTCLGGSRGVGGCFGDDEDADTCNENPCPSWSSWTEGECSVTCGVGSRKRFRVCENGEAGVDDGCFGQRTTEVLCDTEKPCPGWTVWTSWDQCSVTCGEGGVQLRRRTCQYGEEGLQGCLGLPIQEQNCIAPECPYWGEWQDYSVCSASCGGGSRTRRRICFRGVAGLDGCFGSATQTDDCNVQDCPTWSSWNEFGLCSADCDGGIRIRERICINGLAGQNGCLGPMSDKQPCNTGPCATWSTWGEYTQCSRSCGSGTQYTIRTCIGGEDSALLRCQGPARSDKSCNDFDCPSWTVWDKFSSCTVSCGGGRRTRIRYCSNGEIGMDGCEMGGERETIECNNIRCPRWGEWSEFGRCSASCGGGEQTRYRQCQYGVVGLAGCDGSGTETQSCNENECRTWLAWASWESCDVTCGGGVRRRTRICFNGNAGDTGCPGDDGEVQECNTQNCPKLTQWDEWEACSQSCGTGRQVRRRRCIYGKFGDIGCSEDLVDMRDCNTPICRQWTPWSPFGECSTTCGEGSRSRFRLCLGGDPGENGCEGRPKDDDECNNGPCPFWSEWSTYGECSVECDGGVQRRTRVCRNGVAGVDFGCLGMDEEMLECNTGKCQPDVLGNCTQIDILFILDSSSSIGDNNFAILRAFFRSIVRQVKIGLSYTRIAALRYNSDIDLLWNYDDATDYQNIIQRINNIPYDGSGTKTGAALKFAAENMFTTITGNRPNVPNLVIVITDGKANDKPGDDVLALYALGVKVVALGITKGVDLDEINAIASDPDSENALLVDDFDDLNTIVDNFGRFVCSEPLWSQWTQYSNCDVTCGRGTQTRTRICTDGFQPSTACNGNAREVLACNAGRCPEWSQWSVYLPCSATCGGGRRTRIRGCRYGRLGDVGCFGDTEESEDCNTQPCPKWSPWTEWSVCSVECGGGVKTRVRTCKNAEDFSECDGSSEDAASCNNVVCPHYSAWGEWERCSVSCGIGVQERHRFCINPDGMMKGCTDEEGDDHEERECGSANSCPSWSAWEEWSSCDVSCGGGERIAIRQCLNSYSADDCFGEPMKAESCNNNPCPRWTGWSEWTLCSAPCGGGTTSRARVCEYGDIGEGSCMGEDREARPCNRQKCARWTEWGEWSSCSASCGTGMVSRSRGCDGGKVGDIGCEGPVSEEKECFDEICATWSSWGSWGECTRSCGNGVQLRARTCAGGLIGDKGCDDGDELQTTKCSLEPCASCDPDYSKYILDNGRVQCTRRNNAGTVCRFTCKRNYTLAGVTAMTCDIVNNVAIWSSQNPPTCNKKCSDEADVVFVIDSSSSIRSANFAIIRSFIITVIDQFRVGSNAAQFGAIRYNKNVMHLWDLNEHDNKADLLNAVTRIPYDGSGTLTGKAINYTREYMFERAVGGRPGVPKIAVVITDGVSYDDVANPSLLLKMKNVLMIAVGIGRINLAQINEIASDPNENFATTVNNFGSLEKVVNVISDQIKLCQPLPEIEECPPQAVMDLMFIVDSSSSIGRDNFNIVRKFIKDIVATFNINQESAQIGLIRYNRVIDEVLKLDDYSNIEGIIDAVDNMRYSGSGTRTGMALEYAATNALSSASGKRPGIRAITIVLTDGRSQDEISEAAFNLQDKSVVIAVGIKGAIKEQLMEIATGEGETNVFNVQEFAALNAIIGNIAQAVCLASRDSGFIEI